MRGSKRTSLDRLPDCLSLVSEKPEIVNRSQSQSEDFACAKQVMKVGSAEPGTSVTVTLWIERRVNVGESALFDVDAALGCEQSPVTG